MHVAEVDDDDDAPTTAVDEALGGVVEGTTSRRRVKA